MDKARSSLANRVPDANSPRAATAMLKRAILKRGPRWLGNLIRNHDEHTIRKASFYQRHAYAGRLPYRTLDRHTMIHPGLCVFFHRIPKVASSSLLASVLSLQHDGPAPVSQREKRALRSEPEFLHPSDLDQATGVEADDFVKFLFVRNPFSRLLSAYLSKVRGKLAAGKQVTIREGGRSARRFLSDPTFENFGRFLEDGHLYANHHWCPQIDYLTFAPTVYDFIGRFEQLDRDFSQVSRLIRSARIVDEFVPEDRHHATDADDKVTEHYTPYMRDLVFELYRADFEAFGYDRT